MACVGILANIGSLAAEQRSARLNERDSFRSVEQSAARFMASHPYLFRRRRGWQAISHAFLIKPVKRQGAQ